MVLLLTTHQSLVVFYKVVYFIRNHTLYLLYINDLPEVVDSLIKIFADDTKSYDKVDHHKLQECEMAQRVDFLIVKNVSVSTLEKTIRIPYTKYNKGRCSGE